MCADRFFGKNLVFLVLIFQVFTVRSQFVLGYIEDSVALEEISMDSELSHYLDLDKDGAEDCRLYSWRPEGGASTTVIGISSLTDGKFKVGFYSELVACDCHEVVKVYTQDSISLLPSAYKYFAYLEYNQGTLPFSPCGHRFCKAVPEGPELFFTPFSINIEGNEHFGLFQFYSVDNQYIFTNYIYNPIAFEEPDSILAMATPPSMVDFPLSIIPADIGNSNGEEDVQLTIKVHPDETGVDAYRIFAVKPSDLDLIDFTFLDALPSDRYFEVNPVGSDILTTLPAGFRDVTGGAIELGEKYHFGVLTKADLVDRTKSNFSYSPLFNLVPRALNPAVVIKDKTDSGISSDFEITISPGASEVGNLAYHLLVSNTDFDDSIPSYDPDNLFAFTPTGSIQTATLPGAFTTIEGDAISSREEYNFGMLTVGDSLTGISDVFEELGVYTLTQPTRIVRDARIVDSLLTGELSDVYLKFLPAIDEVGIEKYRIFLQTKNDPPLSRSELIDPVDLVYTEINPSNPDFYGIPLASLNVIDGSEVLYEQPYKATIISIGDRITYFEDDFTVSRVTEAEEYLQLKAENILLSDIGDWGTGDDLLLRFDGPDALDLVTHIDIYLTPFDSVESVQESLGNFGAYNTRINPEMDNSIRFQHATRDIYGNIVTSGQIYSALVVPETVDRRLAKSVPSFSNAELLKNEIDPEEKPVLTLLLADEIYFQSFSALIEKVQLFDNQAKLVYESDAPTMQGSIQTGSLFGGIYYLVLEFESGKRQKKKLFIR